MTDVLKCVDCGRRTFYEKGRCSDCGGKRFECVPAGTGKLLAVTTVHVTPEEVREPNALGLATFQGGANIIAQLDDEFAVGNSVELVPDNELRVGPNGKIWGARLTDVE